MSLYEQRAWINIGLSHLVDNHTVSIMFLVVATFWAVVWLLEGRHVTRAS